MSKRFYFSMKFWMTKRESKQTIDFDILLLLNGKHHIFNEKYIIFLLMHLWCHENTLCITMRCSLEKNDCIKSSWYTSAISQTVFLHSCQLVVNHLKPFLRRKNERGREWERKKHHSECRYLLKQNYCLYLCIAS